MQLTQVLQIIIFVASMNNEGKSVEIIQYRIIGGSETVIQNHPYAVSIMRMKTHICGGSIISQNHILTAAHCFYQNKDNLNEVYSNYHILAGKTNVLVDSESRYYENQKNDNMFEISMFKMHPNYNPENDDYDITVLKLRTSLKFSDSIQAINIPDKDFQIQTNDVVYVCGWGQTKHNDSKTSNVLRSVSITIVDWTSCKKSFSELRPLTKNMICAGDKKISKDACFGDSGGPLVKSSFDKKTKESELFIIGIVSWGYKCGDVKYPGVYTNVAQFYKWIKNIMS